MLPDFIADPDPSVYLGDNYVILDLETTNREKGTALHGSNRIVLGCTKQRDSSVETWYESGDLARRLTDLVQSGYFIVAHNAKFELQWLARMGIDTTLVLPYDTLLGERVLAGNKRVPLDLGSVAKRRGYGGKDPFIDICMKGGVCPSEMPKPLLEARCIKDVEQTEKIFLEQRKELHESDRLKTLFTRCIFTPVLADMEFNGLYLDGEKVEETYRDYTNRLDQLSETLSDFAGGINFRSPQQRGEFLYDTLGLSELTDGRGNPLRTPGGDRRTDSDTIVRLKASNRKQREFIRLYREFTSVNAAVTKNLDFFHGVVTENNGLFYGQFNQSVAQTHRLSASGRPLQFSIFKKAKSVQFQNLPRIFKPLFTSRNPGWSIGEIDGSQLEFRVAAHLGRDSAATEAIREGFDVHSYTASVLTDHGQGTERQDAKAHTFKPLYGGQSGTRAERAYYEAFRKRYPGISDTQSDWIATVLAHKELSIPSGLIFYWPNTKLNGDYVTNTPSICNYPVQSYATADIIPIAVTHLWHTLKAMELQSFLINTVHDSAIMELHPDEIDTVKKLSFNSFTAYVYEYLHKVYNDDFTVPLGAEFKVGTHWSTGEETKYAMEPPTLQAA